MSPEETPFMARWWGTDLGQYRECDATDCAFPYESLPPLDMTLFRGEFQWLPDLDEKLANTMEVYRPPEKAQKALLKKLERLLVLAERKGLKLPDPFVKFIGSLRLQAQLPSCTACYFDVSKAILRSPLGDGGYFIRFLNDQQDILLWYLYLKPDGRHCVVVSPIYFDDDFGGADKETLLRHTHFCGATFESFLYRFWLENQIWFALNEDARPLTQAEQDYLKHYKS